MEKLLKINTSCKAVEEEEDDLPVSPSGYYFNSSALSFTIIAVMEIEAPIDDSQAMAVLRDVSGRNKKKQWKKVEVNLEDHIKVPIFPTDSPLEHYDEAFDEYLSNITADPLPQDRSLWEVHIVKYPTRKASGHLVFKFHHALGDGYSLIGALLSCSQRADDPAMPLTFPVFRTKNNPPSVGYYQRISTGVSRAICVAYNTLCDYGSSILKSIVIEDDRTPIRSGNKGLDHKPMSISTMEFSIDKIKQIKNELGMTINDVIVSIVFYGARLYMQGKSGNWVSSNSNVLVLMNTRSINGHKSVSEMLRPNNKTSNTLWGNQFTFLRTSIPQNNEFHEPLKMMFESKRLMQKKKNSLAYKLTAHTIEIVRKCVGPKVVSELFHKMLRNTSIVLTNMVGPIEKITLANHPIKGLYFIVAGGPVSVEIAVISYMQTLRICIGVEKNFIDLQEFKSCIQKAFGEIFDAATKKGK
ncbi:hypothetical protein V2J09_000046 [Rumex salicifolius]